MEKCRVTLSVSFVLQYSDEEEYDSKLEEAIAFLEKRGMEVEVDDEEILDDEELFDGFEDEDDDDVY
jgi:hypothetical protein